MVGLRHPRRDSVPQNVRQGATRALLRLVATRLAVVVASLASPFTRSVCPSRSVSWFVLVGESKENLKGVGPIELQISMEHAEPS